MKIKELLEGEVKKQLYGKVASLPIMKPAVKKSRTETQLENIAKKANKPLTDVKKLYDEIRNDVKPTQPQHYAMVFSRLKRQLEIS